MRGGHSQHIDKAENDVTAGRGHSPGIDAFSEQGAVDWQSARLMRDAAEAHRAHVRTVKLHLDLVIHFRKPLENNFKLRHGVRRGVNILEREVLSHRITGQELAEDVVVLAIEQTRKINQPLLALNGVEKGAADLS